MRLSPCVEARVVALSLGVLTLIGGLGTAAAQAESITLRDTGWERENQRPGTMFPKFLSYEDCIEDNDFIFRPQLAGTFQSFTLEVWVGTADCKDPTNRQANVRDRCWQVFAERPTGQPVIEISPRDVVSRGGPNSGMIADCEQDRGNDQPLPVKFYFLLVQGSEAPVASAEWDSAIDLLGPPAPTNVEANAGDGRLLLEWDPMQAQDALGFDFFCDPPPGTTMFAPGAAGAPGTGGTSSTDAGSGGMGGTSDAGATGGVGAAGEGGEAGATGEGTGGGTSGSAPPECPSEVLASGERLDTSGAPSIWETLSDPLGRNAGGHSPRLFCGSVRGNFSNEGTALGLTNGVTHAVGIAAVDQVGNRGPLSEVKCGTPREVTDFFEDYRQNGGQGGGGFCSLGATPAPHIAALVITGAVALFRRRRGRRK